MTHVADLLRREGFPITFAPPVIAAPGAPAVRPASFGGTRFALGAAAGAIAVAGAVTGGTLAGGVDFADSAGVTGYVPDSGAVIDTAGPRTGGTETGGTGGTGVAEDGSVSQDQGQAGVAPQVPRKVVLVPADVAAANSSGVQPRSGAQQTQQQPAQQPVQQAPQQGSQTPTTTQPAPSQQQPGGGGLLGGIVGGVGDLVGGVVGGVTGTTQTTASTLDDGLQPALTMIPTVGGLLG